MAAPVWWQRKTQQRRIKSTLGGRNIHRAWWWPRSQEKTDDKVGKTLSRKQNEEGNWPMVVSLDAIAVQSWGRKLGHLLKTK